MKRERQKIMTLTSHFKLYDKLDDFIDELSKFGFELIVKKYAGYYDKEKYPAYYYVYWSETHQTLVHFDDFFDSDDDDEYHLNGYGDIITFVKNKAPNIETNNNFKDSLSFKKFKVLVLTVKTNFDLLFDIIKPYKTNWELVEDIREYTLLCHHLICTHSKKRQFHNEVIDEINKFRKLL